MPQTSASCYAFEQKTVAVFKTSKPNGSFLAILAINCVVSYLRFSPTTCYLITL